jgi:GrpB-like predicted nucleotidyltransferase (UPF0157 family)
MGAKDRHARLDDILVGGREKREIVIVDYDPNWPARYELERDRVCRALGASALRVEHIGSTAVTGLAAKPIVDMLVTVARLDDDSSTTGPLEAAGYELRVREPAHRMFRTLKRDVHVHVWEDSDPEVARHMAFREQLRRSPEDRRAYERLKRELAARDWADMNEYADAKSALIAAILAGREVEPRC